jgi:hypothetical protein
VTDIDPAALVERYRAGVDAELQLLQQLSEVAEQQREATTAGDLTRFAVVADRRDELMRNLVALENDLGDVRTALGDDGSNAPDIPGYAELAARHREASQVIARILSIDERSMTALADAELARRSALASLEKGESTLAAYRRVLAPPPEHARLFDRVG